jgi:hypothetical protein
MAASTARATARPFTESAGGRLWLRLLACGCCMARWSSRLRAREAGLMLRPRDLGPALAPARPAPRACACARRTRHGCTASAGPAGDDPAARLMKLPRPAPFTKRAASISPLARLHRAHGLRLWLLAAATATGGTDLHRGRGHGPASAAAPWFMRSLLLLPAGWPRSRASTGAPRPARAAGLGVGLPAPPRPPLRGRGRRRRWWLSACKRSKARASACASRRRAARPRRRARP